MKIFINLLIISVFMLPLHLLNAQSLTLGGVGGPPASSGPPSPPLTNLQFWGRADSLTCTLGCSGSHDVTAWIDKSVNGNGAPSSLGTAGVYAGSSINSQPSVIFTLNEFLFTTPIDLKTASTICAVAKLTVAANKGVLVSGIANSLKYYLGGTKEQGADKADAALLGAGTASADTSPHSICMDYDGTTVHFFIDGASDGSATPAVAITVNETILGAGFNGSPEERFVGNIADVVIYDAVLGSTPRAQWFAYTMSRYGL